MHWFSWVAVFFISGISIAELIAAIKLFREGESGLGWMFLALAILLNGFLIAMQFAVNS